MKDEFKDDYNEIDEEYEIKKTVDKQEGKIYRAGLITGVIWGMAVIFALYIGMNIALEKFGKSNKSINTTSGGVVYSGKTDEKIRLLESYIDKYYYEEVDEEKINDGIYKGLVKSLGDKYSEYYTKEEFEALNNSSQGHYTGIGVVINQNPDSLVITVTKVYPNSPAEEAGVEAGDVIIAIDDTDITSMTSDLVVSMVRGEEGTDVKITINRNGEDIQLNMKRKVVDIQVVSYEMLEGNIGYIILDQFTDSAVEQFREALTDLNNQGMKGLIVDVRENPGGLLTSVKSILSMFLPEKQLILYSMTKEGQKTCYYSEEGKIVDDSLPMIVLIDEDSASAAEVFSGTLKHYQRAELVGVTSFGKGIMQSTFKLSDGTGIKLTTGKYYLPDDSNIHGIGIEPDYEVEMPEDVKNIWALEHSEDTQLSKAIEIIGQK